MMTDLTDFAKFIDQAVKTMTTEFAEAKTVVLWDLEDYKIPDGLNPCKISDNIKTALASMGYNGPVTIQAYCDETNQIKEEDGFLSAGIILQRVPEGGEGRNGSRDLQIYDAMWLWSCRNREPSNLMVISDNVFTHAFDDFKEMNYNVLWTSLSAEGMPIAQSGKSSERLDRICSCCGVQIDH